MEENESEVTENTEVSSGGDDKPAGYYPVDLTDLPEEKRQALDDRINYLYRQVKDTGRTIGEYRTIAQQQAQQIEDLMNGVGKVVDHLQTKSAAESETQIRQKMQEAFESGDTVTYLSEQEKLIELKAQKKIQESKPKEKAREQKPHLSSASQIASEDSGLSSEDQYYVDVWQNELDDSGKQLRPWAFDRSGNNTDPDFVMALAVANRVWQANPDRSAKENLAEVDRIMGVQSKGANQNVIGGGLTSKTKSSKIKMSPDAERIAVRMRFGGPGKTDAEHIEAYRKQIEKVKTIKGGR